MAGLVPRPHRPRLTEPQRRFGAYLRERRQAKRLGLRAFAEKVGLAAGHLSNIENGRVTPPSESIIHKMAEVLEVPPGALLARAGRLGDSDLKRFWESPLIPSLVMTSTGWSQEDAQILQEQVLASMTS
jgi:transcriptional regulator with XRE-family HTH domain